MDENSLLGYKLEEAESILQMMKMPYKVVVTSSVKGEKLGSTLRVVKVIPEDEVILYVAYF